jgi:hypothetical protein
MATANAGMLRSGMLWTAIQKATCLQPSNRQGPRQGCVGASSAGSGAADRPPFCALQLAARAIVAKLETT